LTAGFESLPHDSKRHEELEHQIQSLEAWTVEAARWAATAAAAKKATLTSTKASAKAGKPRKLSFKETRELEGMELQI